MDLIYIEKLSIVNYNKKSFTGAKLIDKCYFNSVSSNIKKQKKR
jgi:hypothetical protein